MMETAASISSGLSGRSRLNRFTRGSRYQVSGGMLSRECAASIIRSSVDPDRPEPTMKKGQLVVGSRAIIRSPLIVLLPGEPYSNSSRDHKIAPDTQQCGSLQPVNLSQA